MQSVSADKYCKFVTAVSVYSSLCILNSPLQNNSDSFSIATKSDKV